MFFGKISTYTWIQALKCRLQALFLMQIRNLKSDFRGFDFLFFIGIKSESNHYGFKFKKTLNGVWIPRTQPLDWRIFGTSDWFFQPVWTTFYTILNAKIKFRSGNVFLFIKITRIFFITNLDLMIVIFYVCQHVINVWMMKWWILSWISNLFWSVKNLIST